MMVATYKCGCPPTEKKPCCKPCASGRSTVRVLEEPPASPGDCPKGACCNKRALKPTVSRPKVEEPPPCCPTGALDSREYERPRKLRSEIAEKGLPYNEMEVAINDNRLVIRSQREEVKPKYDPPCDCVDDLQPVPSHDDEIDQPPVPGTRTVTLYPQMQLNEREANEKNVCPEERTTDEAENPNVFVLRVKRKSNNGDKSFGIDLEFKTPRPWSTRKRKEYEAEWRKLSKVREPSTTETDEVKVDRARKKRKRKR